MLSVWYRVRKTWADASSQKWVFKVLENAKKCADENPGYSVFDESGKEVYTKTAFKPYLVQVSISGLWVQGMSRHLYFQTVKNFLWVEIKPIIRCFLFNSELKKSKIEAIICSSCNCGIREVKYNDWNKSI